MPPRSREALGKLTGPAEGAIPFGLAGKRVVVIDDDGITQLQIRKVIQRAGMELSGAAANGEDGVEMVLKERPDIVLMDIRMPKMGGLEATRRILDCRAVCVVMMTAYPAEEHHAWARQIGASGFVSKPITYEQLLGSLQAAHAAFTHSSCMPEVPPPANIPFTRAK